MTGVVNHKPTPAATVTRSVATSSAPPKSATAYASAVPNIVNDLAPLLRGLVELGSSIQHFDFVHAVQTVFVNTVHTAIQTVVGGVKTVIGGIAAIVGGALFVVALPVEIPVQQRLANKGTSESDAEWAITASAVAYCPHYIVSSDRW
ncbi:hypothetical protein [Mycolicibacterium helvum]|uniref:Uncharacterized protein n=1 Tax=Mycolicibacterium helvum TaxID=1534349 RepID=A0A7I7TCU6_9MYCO|nr:hypothetical protein [Mycolicibacterium helvum]BBY66175.1 hypothetical protein MHEL_44180 [Mycolicibacterium helvum]